MALALFDDDYEEVAARLTETLTAWGCWDDWWSVPTSGGLTQARQRLGYEPLKALFAEVMAPVAEELTAGAFLGPWRLMAIDGHPGSCHGRHRQEKEPQPPASAPDLSPGRQTGPAQLLPGQTARRPWHPPPRPRPSRDQAGQPAPVCTRSLTSH
jgi:hypothetical protein